MSREHDVAGALTLLSDVIRRLHSNDDVGDVLDDIVRGVCSVLGFGAAVINLVREDGRLEVAALSAPGYQEPERLVGRTYSRDYFDADFAAADHWGLLRYVPPERSSHGDDPGVITADRIPDEGDPLAWHPEALLLVPLLGPEEELVGVISLDEPPGLVRPSEQLCRLLEMLAIQAGLAVTQALRRRDRERRAELDLALRRLTQQARGLEIDEVVDLALSSVYADLDAEEVWIRLFADSDSERLGHGLLKGYPWPARAVPADGPTLEAAGQAARTAWRAQLSVAGAAPDPLAEHLPEEQNSLLAAYDAERTPDGLFLPLGAGSQCLGYMTVYRKTGRPWSRLEVEHGLEIGRDVGGALYDARALERERALVRHLRASDAYRQRLIGTLSHELRNPLSSISGHVEMLAEDEFDDPRPSYDVIRRAADRLTLLVDDLLTLLSVDSRSQPLQRLPVDLAAAVRDGVALVQVQADAAQVRLGVHPPAEPAYVAGERAEIDRLLVNLLSNAIKYTPAGGRADLSWGRDAADPATVVVEVSDTGIGISAEDQAGLYDEFFRSTNPAALDRPGSGLGLSIVRRIVTRHGGDIALASAPGEGSTFTVRLPGADPDPDPDPEQP